MIFISMLHEDAIKKAFHMNDYQYQQQLNKEKKLAKFVQTFSTELNVFSLSLTFTGTENQQDYTLEIGKEHAITPIEKRILSPLFDDFVSEFSAVSKVFSVDNIDELVIALEEIKIQLKSLEPEVDIVAEVEENPLDKSNNILKEPTRVNSSRQGILDAVEKNDMDGIGAFILAHSVDATIDENGNTLLHYAILHNKTELVNYLTSDINASLFIKNKANKTAFAMAVCKSDDYFKPIYKSLEKQPESYFLDAKNKEIKQFITELTRIISYQRPLGSSNETPFISFWKNLCNIKTSVGFFRLSSKLDKLQLYYEGPIKTIYNQNARINHFEGVKKALSSDSESAVNWALEQVRKLPGATNLALDKARNLVITHLEELTTERDNAITKATNYLGSSFGAGKVKESPWSKKRKEQLKAQWVLFAQEAGVKEPLHVDIVFRIIASRILVSHNESLYGDALINDLFKEQVSNYALQCEGEKNYWQVILQGLLVLGANPDKTLEEFVVIASKPSGQALNTLYAMSQFSEVILTHLQYRARHLGNCLVEMDNKFERLIKATNQFGVALNISVYEPSLIVRLASLLKKDLYDARDARALLFGSMLRVIYVLLDNDLNSRLIENTVLITNHEPRDEELSDIDRIRTRNIYFCENCEMEFERTTFLAKRGRKEFKELVAAFKAIDGELLIVKASREKNRLVNDLVRHEEQIKEVVSTHDKEIKQVKANAGAEIQAAITETQEERAKRQEAETRIRDEALKRQEAEVKTQEAEVRIQEAEARTQEAEAKTQNIIEQWDEAICERLRKKLGKYIETNPIDLDKQELERIYKAVAHNYRKSIHHTANLMHRLILTEAEFEVLRPLIKSLMRNSVAAEGFFSFQSADVGREPVSNFSPTL